jgi:4-amino-4-deoxy-L-arabinose transferase-like glycosyltransferase
MRDRRSKPLGSARTGQGRRAALTSDQRAVWQVAAVAVGLAAYLVLFHASPMPSLAATTRSGAPPRRIEVLLQMLLLPDEIVAGWFGLPAEFTILDRVPVLAAAGATLLVAGAAGRLLLRLAGADRGLEPIERAVFSLGMGLNAVSLYVLGVGLSGGLQSRWAFAVPAVAVLAVVGGMALLDRRNAPARSRPEAGANEADDERPGLLSPRWLWLTVPFVALMLLGAMLPPVDFDVREYHMQAPKEFFQQGRITFLPHNIYGNFPLGVEILGIPAMALSGDWWWGSIVGKTLIGCFAPLTALALFAAGRRFFSMTAGVVAAVVYLSTPWIHELSSKGLIEGAAAFYLLLAVYALLLWRGSTADDHTTARRRLLLTGFLAGAAVACKYPAALFVLAPLGAWVFWISGIKALANYGVAAAVACGPWLAKNAVFTGNPVYPLLYGLFDGATRTPGKNAQWVRHHSPPNFDPADLLGRLADIGWRSEWLGPLLWPLAALGVYVWIRGWRDRLWTDQTRLIAALCVYFAFIVVAWWLATHRIDRFWAPALPIVALLAGAGATWTDRLGWRRALIGLLLVACGANLLINAAWAGGDHRYFVGLDRLRVDPARVDPWHLELNSRIQPGETVLLVGDAQPFDLEMPAFYNTVFDDSVFELIVRDREPEDIRRDLAARGIRYVYVHWGEIDRYRSPGNYGFTDFVQPEVFERLVGQGVLEEPLRPLADHPGRVYRVKP